MVHMILMFVVALFGNGADSHYQHQHGGSSGQETAAATSSLSADDVTALLTGDGMGQAKAAELNGYPGPKHVLELASALELTEDQAREVTTLRANMLEAAIRLGHAIVNEERMLDEAFRSGTMTADDLTARVSSIARLKGDLRAVHLAAHIATRTLLTRKQTERYRALRAHGGQAPRVTYLSMPFAGVTPSQDRPPATAQVTVVECREGHSDGDRKCSMRAKERQRVTR
jgi:Arc/MetJ family transcription regulator